MNRTVVLASSYVQYINFIDNFNLDKNLVGYVKDFDQILAMKNSTPLIILEGYEYNPNYTVGFMKKLNFFTNYGKFIPAFLSEREIYFESPIL